MKLASIKENTIYFKSNQIAIIESIKSQKVNLIAESEIKGCFPNASKELISEYKNISENFLKVQSLFVNSSVDKLYKLFEDFDPNKRMGGDDFGGDAAALSKAKSGPQAAAREAKPKAAMDPVDPKADPEKRMGGGDFGGDAKAMGKKPDEKEKKGLISKLKEFYSKINDYMKKHPGQKMIIILAALGIVMTIASAFPAVGMLIKAVFGVWNMYKGKKKLGDELAKGKDKSGWQVALGVFQMAAGIFSVASVGADVISTIASQKAALVSTATQNGIDLTTAPADAAAAPGAAAPAVAPAGAVAAPAADVAGAAAAAPVDMFTQGEQLKGTLGKVTSALRDSRLADQYLNDPEKYIGKFTAFCAKLGISPDTPVEQVFKGVRVTGGTTIKDYIEMTLEGSAKAAKMAAMSRQ